METIALLAAGWIIAGLIGAGGMVADWEYNSRPDPQYRRIFLATGIFSGPVGLVLSLLCTGFFYHGWRRPW